MSFEGHLLNTLSQADVVEVINDVLFYEGYFLPGPSKYDQPCCKIIQRKLVDNVWYKMYADGDEEYDNVWDNRKDLNYSHLK